MEKKVLITSREGMGSIFPETYSVDKKLALMQGILLGREYIVYMQALASSTG